ncbi:MAG: transposase [Bacteroidota bacterium]
MASVYPIVFLDTMHQKVEDNGCVKSKRSIACNGNQERGKKETISFHVNKSEGANC